MIKSFKCKETERIFNRLFSKKLPQEIQRAGYKKLLMLDAAFELDDLKIPPSNQLEKLSGDREGMYSIRVNKQYRLCFTFDGSNAEQVEIIDYH